MAQTIPPVKFAVDTLDDIPKPLQPFFDPGPEGKGFVFRLEGHPDTARAATFRENNRAMHAELNEAEAERAALKAALAKFDGIDSEQARQALADLSAQADAAKTHEAKAAQLAADLERERAEHAATKLRHKVTTIFLGLGGRKEASVLDYMAGEAAKVFKPGPDGEPTTSEYSPTNATAPLSVEEWVTAQITARPFAFEPPRGGGAHHSQATPGARSVKVISGDPLEFGKNLESIARGETVIAR